MGKVAKKAARSVNTLYTNVITFMYKCTIDRRVIHLKINLDSESVHAEKRLISNVGKKLIKE